MVNLDTQMDDVGKIVRMITRKSQRLNGVSDLNGVPGRGAGPQSPLRRSSRTITLTTRHQSNITAVLKRTDDVKKKRRLSESKKISESQRRKTLVAANRDLSDEEEDIDEHDGDIDMAQLTVDDNIGGAGPSFDPRLNRATSVHYQGLIDELSRGQSWPWHRGSYCIRGGRSRIWATRRQTKHAHEVSSQEEGEEDDDDDNEQREFHSRCRPLNLGREDIVGSHRDWRKGGVGLTDMDSMVIGQAVGFDSVGGLSGHISALKEMVVFPLLYPEVFDNFKIQPPRGCLFYGPPGTGKTLVARALAHESSQGERKVAFFMRKGADCLSKWVGETERQLRLLFEQAYHMRPSIIFFDEIDGLAPVRSSRQDHIHSSIVSTLLALMDGLDDRGGVVVIGATNRLDSVDPALRRPGRFDRELLFSLPDRESRSEILRIHTRQWNPCPSEGFLEELAEKTVGYCGADIRAVCTEAALCALRRRYPQIYDTPQKLLLDVSSIAVKGCDFLAAMKKMVPASQRSTTSPAKSLAPVVRPLLGPTLRRILESLLRQFPHAEQGLKKKPGILDDDLMYRGEECSCDSISKPFKGSSYMNCTRGAVHHPMSHRPRMLLAGRPGAGQGTHLAPAILHALERFTVHMLDVAKLFGVSYTSPEEACAQVFLEAKRTSPSILYLPHIQQWWETSDPVLRATFISLLQDIPSFSPILLLATSDIPHKQLDAELQVLFRVDYGEVHSVRVPTQQERSAFFEDLVLSQAAKAPASKKKALMQESEVLPVAPPPAQWQPSEQERLRLEEQEEDVLRELRLFLRDVTERLRADHRFKAFNEPVDIEEVPNYLRVIKKPMDLSTLLSNIDQHRYVTVGGFVADADLIWQNALRYNAESDPCGRLIRHRAYAFKDTVHSIIRHELDEDFEKVCEEIMESRIKRGCTSSSSAPSYCQNHTTSEDLDGMHHDTPQSESRMKKLLKRPRKTKWSNGIIKKGVKRKAKPPSHPSSSTPNEEIGGAEAERGETTPTRVTGPILENGCHGDSLDESSASPSGSVNWGGEGEQSTHTPAVNGLHLDLAPGEDPELYEVPGVQNGIHVTTQNHPLVNGNHRLQSLNPTRRIPPQRARFRGNGELLSDIEYRTQETYETLDTLNEMTALVVDHDKLRDLHKRVVLKTEGMNVCQLEKLYTLLAQCIYRQRKNYNKARLIQEMKREIDTFS